MSRFTFEAEAWEYPGPQPWTFVTVPSVIADAIKAEIGGGASGFGSVRVRVALGTSRWNTSLFPSNEHGSFLLPLKKAVRSAEQIGDGDTVTVEFELQA